jgi:hypothetical protein
VIPQTPHQKNEEKNVNIKNISNISNSELSKIILHKYNNNKLPKYLGDSIYNFYGNAKSKEQSIWSSDVSRLSFLVRKKCKNTKNIDIWERDPKGEEVKDNAVKPLLQIVIDLMNEYISENNITSNMTSNDMHISLKNLTTATCIRSYAETDLELDILKYIAPKFALKRNNYEYISNSENELSDGNNSDSSFGQMFE